MFNSLKSVSKNKANLKGSCLQPKVDCGKLGSTLPTESCKCSPIALPPQDTVNHKTFLIHSQHFKINNGVLPFQSYSLRIVFYSTELLS